MGLDLIPLIALVVSSLFSIVALFISYRSYRNSKLARRSSEEAQYHTQVVEYEKCRTELRQVVAQTQLLFREIAKNELYREFRDTQDLSHLANSLRKMETGLPHYYEIPPTPSTGHRITLEQIRAIAIELQTYVQEIKLIAQRITDSKD